MGSTQLRLQFVSAPQSGAQVPARHTSGAAQTAPPLVAHAPQFVGSALTSTQLAPQRVSPVVQAQVPAVHVSDSAQAVPHAPQFALLEVVSTQVVPHWASPRGQGDAPPVATTPPPADIPPAWSLLGSVPQLTTCATAPTRRNTQPRRRIMAPLPQ
jgi:hypothetical protein